MGYILKVAGEVPFEIIRAHVVDVAPATEEPMASAAEQLIQEGIHRGRVQTLRHTLARQLRARFGASAFDATVQARIDQASPEELDRWIERFATAVELDEVFAP